MVGPIPPFDNYEIYKYRGADTYKTLTWKSKKFQWPYQTNFACGRVIADWMAYSGKYFTFSTTTTNYYCWFTVDGVVGDLPVLAGTMVLVALLGTDSPTSVASKIAAEIDDLASCSATAVGTIVTITNSSDGVVTHIDTQTSAFSVAVSQAGAIDLPEISTVDVSSGYTITIRFYVDGILKQTVSVTNSDVFRLISGFIGRVFEIELTGAIDVDFAGIAQTPMDISL